MGEGRARLLELIASRDELRARWRKARNARLSLSDDPAASGISMRDARHDGKYRALKKTQKACTVQIRQIERKISRELSRRQVKK